MKERKESIKSQVKDLKEQAKDLMREIKEIKSKVIILAPDEVKILEKLNEAVNIWGYEVIRKNETVLLYKKRELEKINSAIKITEEMIK